MNLTEKLNSKLTEAMKSSEFTTHDGYVFRIKMDDKWQFRNDTETKDELSSRLSSIAQGDLWQDDKDNGNTKKKGDVFISALGRRVPYTFIAKN